MWLPRATDAGFSGWGLIAPVYPACVGLVGWQRLQRSLMVDVAAGTVLEVGCGPAPPVRELLGRGVGYLGVDSSDAVVRRAARHLRGARPGRWHVLVGEAEQLPLADASVDLVVSTAVLCLLPVPRRRAALAEMARVCRGEIRLLEPVLRVDRRTPWLRHRLVGLVVERPLDASDFQAAGLAVGTTGGPCVGGVYSPLRARRRTGDLRP